MPQPRFTTLLPVLFACTLLACPKAVAPTKCDANCEAAPVDAGGPEDAGPQDAGPPPCEPGLTQCSGVCTDLTADIDNCSACGMTCPSGNVCTASACAAIPSRCPASDDCPSGSFCNSTSGKCVAGCQGDSNCSSTQICSNKTCVAGCRTDTDCTSAPYVCSANACVLPCMDDTSCASGDVCNPSGHCLPGADGGVAFPAPFATPPQVVSDMGPVLATPRLVPIFFPDGDSDGGIAGDNSGIISSLTSFTDEIGSTTYWPAAMAEWGVGAAAATPVIDATAEDLQTIISAGTVADQDIQSWLGHKLATDPTWPVPDDNTVYIVYFPDGVTVTIPSSNGGTSMSCQQFGGYHSNFTVGSGAASKNVAYAVVPRCGSFGALTGLAAITGPASHEIAEASSDPYPSTDPAFVQVDNAHLAWEVTFGGGEIGDMCAQDPNAFHEFLPFPFTVQRIWSNKSARAGTDPCQPEEPGEVYFNSAIEMNDVADINFGGQILPLAVTHIPIGSSKTIPVDLFSEGPTAQPWTVTVEDYSHLTGGPTLLQITQDKTSGLNGDKIQATITPLTAGSDNLEFIWVISSQGPWTNLWVGAVAN